jgi:hypothetical protein
MFTKRYILQAFIYIKKRYIPQAQIHVRTKISVLFMLLALIQVSEKSQGVLRVHTEFAERIMCLI